MSTMQMAIGGGLSWILPISLCAHSTPILALNPFGHQKGKVPPVAKRKHEELTATDRR